MAFELGQEAINAALALAPDHAFANCEKGMLCSAGGQLEEAAEAFDKALTTDPRFGVAHGHAGYNAAFLGHAEETLPAVERAMRFDQTDRRHSVFFFFGGFAEMLLGRTDGRDWAVAKIAGTQSQLWCRTAVSDGGRCR